MQDFMKVTGMVIGAFLQGEYDRRIVLLTREQGKITAFVKGARRQGSRFTASTDLFVYGEFDLYVGRTSYNVQDVRPSNYFEFLRTDMNAAYYAMYFTEVCDYYAHEGNDESMLLLNLYRAFQGLKSEKLKNSFIKPVFEIKTFSIEGELIPPDRLGFNDTHLLNAVNYICASSIEKLYSFSLTDDDLAGLTALANRERKALIDKHLNSLDMLDVIAQQ